jgi:hypothetical protein
MLAPAPAPTTSSSTAAASAGWVAPAPAPINPRSSAAAAAGGSTAAGISSSGAAAAGSSGAAAADRSKPEGYTLQGLTLVEAPGWCTMQAASQLALLVTGSIYNDCLKLLSTAQKLYQAAWPRTQLQNSWWPIVSAAAAGAVLFGMTAGCAAIAITRTGTTVHVTMATAAIYSSALGAALGDMVEALLALEVRPVLALAGPVVIITGINAASWLGVAFASHPWPFWVGRVLAAVLQAVAKGASAAVAHFHVKLPDATVLVGSSPSLALTAEQRVLTLHAVVPAYIGAAAELTSRLSARMLALHAQSDLAAPVYAGAALRPP